MFSHFPILSKLISAYPPEINRLYDNVQNIVKARREEFKDSDGFYGTDFIARIIEMQNARRKNPKGQYFHALNDKIINAQASVFVLAGLEGPSSCLASLVGQLAKHQEIQDTIRAEIFDALELHEGPIDYDLVYNLEYLDATIYENLRMFPPIFEHYRYCMKDCEVSKLKLKGTVALTCF